MIRYELASLSLRIWSLVFLAQFKGKRWVLYIEKRLWSWKAEAYFKIEPDSGELRPW